jgi:pimeloyl-ACP methyl ester carboxylesterase
MTRRAVEFNAGGVILRGWFYAAEASPAPAVVMAHGFAAAKEMYLGRFAEVFNKAGLSVLVFDNRSFGASDGEPRQETDPWAQVRDYRHAITYASTLAEVDAARIGIWGSPAQLGGPAAAQTGGSADRRPRAPLLLERVLDLVPGLLEVALGLVALALGFHFPVAGRLAQGLLDVALDFRGLVGRLVFRRHDAGPFRCVVRFICPRRRPPNDMTRNIPAGGTGRSGPPGLIARPTRRTAAARRSGLR